MAHVSPRYSAPAQALHWLTALAIFCALAFGLTMLNVGPGDLQNRLFDLHRSFGALILVLTSLRLLWRLYVSPPPTTVIMPAWQERAAHITHIALYVLLFAIPLVGWAGTSAFGAKIPVFGLFELPAVLEKNKPLAEVLFTIHRGLAFTLCGLLVLHMGAALQHHIVNKDDTLRRMLPKF